MNILKVLALCFFVVFLIFATLFVREKNLEVSRVDQLIEQASNGSSINETEDPIELSAINSGGSNQKILIYEIISGVSLIVSIIISIFAFRRKT
ncbi:hypothetical protein ABET51_15800 [Metabacillus fastidiosus]|uniref:hypothetical protein n=1 Tax=Metabacillus fastidiosus TaxID=1458 RepID=UPI002E21C4A7|nr:hypothetical protein [Metabacillus fastidiosus]